MAPPVFDPSKLYKILNVQHSNQAADLIFANPNGPIAGYEKNSGSNNQSWKLNNVGVNQFTLQNGTTGTYAFAYAELEGVPLSGNKQAYKFALIDVKPGVYQIATVDLNYVWVLERADNYFSILLKYAKDNKGPEAQWTSIPA